MSTGSPAIRDIAGGRRSASATARSLKNRPLQLRKWLRGAPAESRQVVLHTQVFDVHVKVSGKESDRRIMAQLLPSQPDTMVDRAKIQLHIPGCPAQVTRSNELGQFTFSGVPNGTLLFFIELPSSGNIIQFSIQGG